MKEGKGWRMSISMTEDMEREIVELRKDERFTRLSYSEIIRRLLEAGIKDLKSHESA